MTLKWIRYLLTYDKVEVTCVDISFLAGVSIKTYQFIGIHDSTIPT